MMKDQNVNNSACGFSGDLIGYIYDEIDGSEKLNVERHLAECESCAREFGAVSSARNSVHQWFSQEFAALPTPQFQFEPEDQYQRSTMWSVWAMLNGIRFRVPIIAAVSVLVVLGAVFFLRSTDVDPGVVSVSLPAVSIPSDEGSNADLAESARVPIGSSDPTNSTAVAVDSHERLVSANPAARPAGTRKLAGDKPKPRETRTNERYARTFPSDRSVAEGIQAKPSLNGYEEKEDESLRLEDIFSEIDAS